MNLELRRRYYGKKSTMGTLHIESKFFCYTLEDVVRDEKIKHHTAIPYGTYPVVVNMSNRFKELMPLLRGVPNFEGIRIHPGNTSEDTSGCILVGYDVNMHEEWVGQSRKAFTDLMAILLPERAIQITILDEIEGATV